MLKLGVIIICHVPLIWPCLKETFDRFKFKNLNQNTFLRQIQAILGHPNLFPSFYFFFPILILFLSRHLNHAPPNLYHAPPILCTWTKNCPFIRNLDSIIVLLKGSFTFQNKNKCSKTILEKNISESKHYLLEWQFQNKNKWSKTIMEGNFYYLSG